jgi:hypothetical protein
MVEPPNYSILFVGISFMCPSHLNSLDFIFVSSKLYFSRSIPIRDRGELCLYDCKAHVFNISEHLDTLSLVFLYF